MDTQNCYTTIGNVFDYIVTFYQETGEEPTFPAALEGMRQRGMLMEHELKIPPFYSVLDRESFLFYIRSMPIYATPILGKSGTFHRDPTVMEPDIFPPEKDIFCFLNMPYMSRKLHFHDFFEITYVLEGECTLLFEGETASLAEGDVCITSPMAAHSLPLKPGCIAVSYVVRKGIFNELFGNLLAGRNLVSIFFRNCLYQPRRANYILLRTDNDRELHKTAQELFYECNRVDHFADACSAGLLNLFLARAMRASAAITLHRIENDMERDFDFTLVLQYIQQNYQTVTLSSLAESFHFSESYLSKLIHKHMGYSFTDILRQVKMDHAMDCLMNRSMRINDIANTVGYDSVDHFSRTFRRVYGMSPQQYRKHHANDHPAAPEPRS